MEPQKYFKHILDEENSIQLFSTGRVFKLVLGGKTIIQARQPYEELGSGQYLMYPWVNRLEQPHPNLPPQNFDGNGLPLHGMVVNEERTIEVDKQKNIITLTLKKNIPNVPAFTEDLILQKNKLTVKFEVVSQNSDPVCFGYHPFLQINGTSLEKLKIKTNISKNIKLDQKLLPVFPFEYKNIEINEKGSYDDLFVVEDEKGGYLQLIDQNNKTNLRIQSSLKYWQVYTPPDRTRIAVQPMSFCANLYKLYPKVKGELPETGSFSISLQK